MLGTETGWNIQALMNIRSNQEIPFFQPEYIKAVMANLVKRAIEEHGLQPVLEVVREMPCDEDFERWDTNVRKDFIRKWHHTRSKRVQTVSLEEYMEDEESGIHEIEDSSAAFEDGIINTRGWRYRVYDTATPFLFTQSFVSFVGLSAWIPGAASHHWGRNCSRNRAIIRTRHRQELAAVVGSDYMGLVPLVGLEPTRHCWQRILSPPRLPIPTQRRTFLQYD